MSVFDFALLVLLKIANCACVNNNIRKVHNEFDYFIVDHYYNKQSLKSTQNAIIDHWYNNLPAGVTSAINGDYRSPTIFWNGRHSHPLQNVNASSIRNVWLEDNYYSVSSDELWTLALTKQNPRNIDWCMDYTQGQKTGYLVVFKLKTPRKIPVDIKEINGKLSEIDRKSNKILGRIGWDSEPVFSMKHEGNGFDIDVHPDSYIITKTAQLGSFELDIIRIYEIHFYTAQSKL